MAQLIIPSDVLIQGLLNPQGGIALPANSVGNSQIPSSAQIDDAKLMHRHALHYHQDPGGNVVAESTDLHIVQGSTGEVLAVQAAITGVIPATYACAVDLQKSTGGGSFTSILSAAIALDSTCTLYIPVDGVITTAGLVAGDILRAAVTISGGSGTHPQGLTVTVLIVETPT